MPLILPAPPTIEKMRQAGVFPEELVTWKAHDAIWRIHRTTGTRVIAWNGFRNFGPILRFDHHPLPPSNHPKYGIWYGTTNPRSAIAEAFQSSRIIDPQHCVPFLTSIKFTRSLLLLDVSGIGKGAWATRLGGNHTLDSAAHRQTQHWARTIHRAYSHLDGIIYRGRFAGAICFALFERAANAFPIHPEFSQPLNHPALADRIYTAAHELGYTITSSFVQTV